MEHTHIECYSCGIQIGVTEEYKNRLISTKKPFWCPNGHEQHFTGESDKDKASRLLAEVNTRDTKIRSLETQISTLIKPKVKRKYVKKAKK